MAIKLFGHVIIGNQHDRARAAYERAHPQRKTDVIKAALQHGIREDMRRRVSALLGGGTVPEKDLNH